ncbi:hypothetical protein BD560DRAFT_214447 [Blakeslea trispora]|nr:hypothetical protein BD560DRAFT_214447 [Blakeslea trispora]
MSHRKTFSQDSACDSSADIDYGTKRDDASIYSHKSTTSSVFSTASRISRIPSAVKSSVKYLVRRNKSKHHDDTFLSQIDHESLGSKIKRSTINFNPFRKNHQDTTHLTHEIIPNTTISSSLYTSANSNSSNTTLSSTSHYSQLSSKPTRQNSIARVASRLSSKSEKVPHHLDNEKEGVSTNSKSEKMAAKKREEPWMRQRAKSCQENNSPMLRQLATKGSSTKLVVDLPQSTGPLPYKANHKSFDLPHFKDLVTTTLTTLHTRLTNECDRTISMMLSAKNNPSSDTFNPKENLLSIISDLYKMTTMVNWENRDKEDQVKLNIQQLEKTITHDELNLISVKDIVSHFFPLSLYFNQLTSFFPKRLARLSKS